MNLIQLKLKNFRSYRNETDFNIKDLTCIIGKNDVGKSTILEALDCFFNGNVDKGDLSTESEDNIIEITCIFDDIPTTIILDSSIETNPIDEKIVNAKGQLEIKKEFKIGKTISKATYLVALHPTHNDLKDILSLKNTPLKSLAEKVEADLTGVPKTKNPSLRQAIRKKVESEEAEILIKIDGNLDTENNLKTVWSKLKKLLPIYSIFKVDKNIDDKDKDVQDPMKQAIKESLALPEIQQLLERIEDEVKVKSSEVAERTLEKLKDIDESLAEKMKSDFSKVPTWDKIFDLTLLNENDIPLNKRGSGVKRLVLLSFFQAQSEQRKFDENAPAIIYAIEEPETAQHPNHQRILINSLIDLSNQDNVQVLFTTHSANLVKEIPTESLNYIYKTAEGNQIDYGINENGEINDQTLDEIIDTLGLLPNPKDSVRTLLFVEGNHDVNALKRYSKILHDYDETFIDLNDNEKIGIIISGGSSLKFYIDNKYLDGLGKPEVHIYDNDIDEYRTYVKNINSENSDKKRAFNTGKLELENYLSNEAIEEAYADDGIVVSIPRITDEMDVPLEVAKALHLASSSDKDWNELSETKQKKKESKVKKQLNTKAVEHMTIERIQSRGGYEDMKTWFDTINYLSCKN